ncbi:hypothetical protein VPH35_131529 [Triticum aestivum]
MTRCCSARSTGGVWTCTVPSSACTTCTMVGRCASSSWMHQHATLHTRSSSSGITSPRSRRSATVPTSPSTTFPAAQTGKKVDDPRRTVPAACRTSLYPSELRRPEMSSKSTIPKLYTSALALMGCPKIHSGARYPMVPRMVVSARLKSLPTNFAIPKSAILGDMSSSSRMFSGLISQCMMHSWQPWCK